MQPGGGGESGICQGESLAINIARSSMSILRVTTDLKLRTWVTATEHSPFPEKCVYRRIKNWCARLAKSSGWASTTSWSCNNALLVTVFGSFASMVVDGANPVTTQHLLHGTERECQKMGKVVSENKFDMPISPPRTDSILVQEVTHAAVRY
jgi:hypothetical protein